MNREKTLTFDAFEDETFDYLLAQSVFTHLPQPYVEQCFENLNKMLHTDSRFFFTFWPAESVEQRGNKGFGYPSAFFEKLALRYGYLIEDRSAEYGHPSGQRMSMLRPLTSANSLG